MMVAFWLVLISAHLAAAPAAGSPGSLTFEQRVEAQRALARVSYAHQAGATRPFDEAVPDEMLARQVATSLKRSAALESIWGVRLTAPMLRAELERMALGTRMPSRLRELYGALEDDLLLLMECLARPALVDRLVH